MSMHLRVLHDKPCMTCSIYAGALRLLTTENLQESIRENDKLRCGNTAVLYGPHLLVSCSSASIDCNAPLACLPRALHPLQ